MPLEICPQMTARCPHYRDACKDRESKQCLYVQINTASKLLSLQAIQIETLTPEMEKFSREANRFLEEQGMRVSQK